MQVIVLNESSKKALMRSRRVLSKFLPQLGASTWAGAISEDGLDELKAALKAAGVSKGTAISCLRVEGRGRLVRQWILGSSACFDDNGRYAFRQTAYREPVQPPAPVSAAQRLVSSLLRLAGLTHDSAKASEAFADKLKRGHGGEAIRHDLMSFLMLAESLWSADVSDEAWLERVQADPASLVSCVQADPSKKGFLLISAQNKWLGRVIEALEREKSNRALAAQGLDADDESSGAQEERSCLVSGLELQQLMGQAPVLASLLWLVLTHHRLPNSDSTAQAWWAGQHVNVPSSALNAGKGSFVCEVQPCLQQAEGTPPWADEGWLKAVSAAAAACRAALSDFQQEGGQIGDSTWALFAANYLRPTLILADHLGTQRAPKSFKKTDKRAKGVIYANTREGDRYGDVLSAHELAVARLTRKVSHLYQAKWPTATPPANSLCVIPDLKGKFEWQLDLENACRSARQHGPVFSVVIAETGAGKTLAGLRSAHALTDGKLRVTLALGLRSLTQQSGTAMVKDADLPPSDVVIAVGQPQTLALGEKYKAQQEGVTVLSEDDPASSRFGSESAEGGSEDVSLYTLDVSCLELAGNNEGVKDDAEPKSKKKKELQLDWLEGFCSEKEAENLWGAKTLEILAAPVLVCTTDHLVRGATLLRGGDAKMYTRLASADLLLDEIDAYSAADLQSLGKLALIAGLHGRNVTLMSATLSPQIREGLYLAWQEGLKARHRFQGGSLAHACVFSSNTVKAEVYATEEVLSADKWEAYVAKVSAVYDEQVAKSPRRTLAVADVDLAGSEEAYYETSIQAAHTMHKSHFTVDPATGKRVSVGFVRLNTAGHARGLAKYLDGRPQGAGPDIRYVAYHSKFPRTYLGVLDVELASLTQRKNPAAFLQVPALRDILDSSSADDVMVVVCTTTLIETGRDFDFDWCVCEPSSSRGFVQAIGRVRRHRDAPASSAANVAILSHPMRALGKTASEKQPVWLKPGIETEFGGSVRVTLAKPTLPHVRSAAAHACSHSLSDKPPVRTLGTRKSVLEEYAASAREALPVSTWEKRLHAGVCLARVVDYANNRIGFLEQALQEGHLLGPSAWNSKTDASQAPSLNLYLRSLASLNLTHAKKTPFRGNKETRLLFVPHAGNVQYVDELSSTVGAPKRREAARVVWENDSEVCGDKALLPDLQKRAEALFTGTDGNVDGCALRCPAHQGGDKKAVWHPLLGFQE